MSTVKIHEREKEWAIKVTAGIVAIVFCYALMIHSAFQDIAAMRQSIADSKKRLELSREVQELMATVDSRESALATVAERSQLIGKISDVAGQTELRVETLTPRTEPEGGYTKLRMEMEGQGTFFSLLKFLQAVEKIGAAVQVRDVTILWNSKADAEKKAYPLQIQLVFETFLKKKAKKNNA